MIDKFYSQAGQDKWICDIFRYLKGGTYVDIGAYDGIQTSNTYVLEKDLHWTGICIEPNKDIFKLLENNRTSTNYNLAVLNRQGQVSFMNDKVYDYSHSVYETVDCDTLYNILLDSDLPEVINYLSIDIEGMEYTVLEQFFNDINIPGNVKFKFYAITVEHNLYCDGPTKKNMLYSLLTSNGYTRVHEDVKCLDPNPAYFGQPYEDWYILI